MNSKKTVFVDSSVFFTAVNSPTGGSAKVFSLSPQTFDLIVSPVVLTEVERNVRKKLPEQSLERLFLLVDKVKIVKQKPDESLIKKAKRAIVEKDAVILAEAKQAKSDYLITLDKKHFFTEKAKNFVKPCQIVTPKMLLEEM
jgi:predicted nucleic acid-binding protein